MDSALEQPGPVELLGRVNAQSRPQADQNAYLFRVSGTGAWSIVKSGTSGTYTTLASGTTTALGTGAWHTISLTMQGPAISGAVDGQTVGSVTDSSYQTGQAGLGVVGYQTDQFSNLSITPGTGTGPAPGPITSGAGPGECVADSGGSSTDGTAVVLQDCDGSASEQWTEENGTLQINGKCMDVFGQGITNGTLVDLWDCNGGPNQQWTASSGELVSAQSGSCLDDPGFATANGTQLDIWTCNGGSNQQWALP
jgi:hypothetical protein